MTKRLFIISLVGLCYFFIQHKNEQPIVHPPGILVAEKPSQQDVQPSIFKFDDYSVTRRAKFEIRARVLSTEPYYLSRESDLSPIDLALGWGVMSDQSLLDLLKISQSGRWYRYRYETALPVSAQQLVSTSANMHMIPARAGIEKSLKKIRPGDIIVLRGHLVDVDHDSGWRWRTSMTRNDSGAGACEVVYVESVTIETTG